MLVSPTEQKLQHLGKSSPVPEMYGADFLFTTSSYGLVGVQRKEVSDLVSSVHDGRLSKELAQMKQLGLGILLIEGRIQWSTDGSALMNTLWTKAQHRGLIFSVQSKGIWVGSSLDLDDTCVYLLQLMRWLIKRSSGNMSSGLVRRPGPNTPWGMRSNKDWAVHFLCGLEGMGPETAEKILDTHGMPFAWKINDLDLQQIPGIGARKAAKWIGALE